MKNKKRIMRLPFLLIGLFLVFASSCEKDDDNGQENVPVLSTTEVTEITANTATSGGNITDDGGLEVTARGVVWSESENPTVTDNEGMTTDGSGTGEFTSDITGLFPQSTYYVRAYATNSEGTAYGEEKSFTTEGELAVVTTANVTNITHESAVSGGEVTDDGGLEVTARGVVWSGSENPTVTDNEGMTTDGSGTGEFTSDITGLFPQSTYYVRAYATNSEGTAYGEEKSFTTEGELAVVTTANVTNITHESAVSGGEVTDDGGLEVTARGVCWSTNENPTIADNKTEDGTGAGSFTSSITDLEPTTTYYLRAYATNSAGTGYGSAMSFTTQEVFTDPRDGKVYQTVVIGNQEWLAENLAYAPSSGNYWAYDNDDANVEVYGYLYDWQTALDVCPTGWHLPSDAEWTELTDYLGTDAGSKLAGNAILWADGSLDQNANFGETAFTALPGGYRSNNGTFGNIGNYGFWWSATEFDATNAWSLYMSSNLSNVNRDIINKELGLSVRCLRD